MRFILLFLVLLPFQAPAEQAVPLLSGLYLPQADVQGQGQVDRWQRPAEIELPQRIALLHSGQAQLFPEAAAPSADELAAEADAQQAQRGLWGDDCCKILAADAFIPFNSWRVVRGTVHSVSVRREAVFVNFAADWKTDFTIILKPALAKKLQAASWAGQALEVRGWVESYYGPAVKVTQPAQIRLLGAAKSRTNKP